MSAETRRMAEARRLMGQHGYRHDAALLAALERAEKAENGLEEVERQAGTLQVLAESLEARAHAAEQSLGEADAEIERLKARAEVTQANATYWFQQDADRRKEIDGLGAKVRRVVDLAEEYARGRGGPTAKRIRAALKEE